MLLTEVVLSEDESVVAAVVSFDVTVLDDVVSVDVVLSTDAVLSSDEVVFVVVYSALVVFVVSVDEG